MSEVNYINFRVGDLFDIHPTKYYKCTDSYLFALSGANPVVKNTKKNNGIGGYSSLECTENGGIITFSDTTTAEAIFYQPDSFIGYSHIQGMYPYSDKWTDKSMIYFMIVFKKCAIEKGFDYENKFTREIANDIRVSLPAIDENTPDFEYMSSYISDIEAKQIIELQNKRDLRLHNYLNAACITTYDFVDEDTYILNKKVSYKKYALNELFTQQKGDTDIKKIHINGAGEPVISSGLTNQGVIGKTDVAAKIINANTITVDMFGNVFFRDFSYKMVTHARVFSLESIENISDEAQLYIVSKLKYLKAIYSYQNICTWEKIERDTIELPISDDGCPDYEYMKRFITAIKKKVVKEAINMDDIIIQKTKKIIENQR